VTIGNKNMRFIKAGGPLALVLTLALVLVPVGASATPSSGSDAGVSVCNSARPNNQGGGLVVQGDVALHHADGLTAMTNGNSNAAEHSRALALCGADAPTVPSGVDVGIGGGSN